MRRQPARSQRHRRIYMATSINLLLKQKQNGSSNARRTHAGCPFYCLLPRLATAWAQRSEAGAPLSRKYCNLTTRPVRVLQRLDTTDDSPDNSKKKVIQVS